MKLKYCTFTIINYSLQQMVLLALDMGNSGYAIHFLKPQVLRITNYQFMDITQVNLNLSQLESPVKNCMILLQQNFMPACLADGN